MTAARHLLRILETPHEHDEPNAKRLAPDKTGEVVWRFTRAGRFEYGCLIPGHREAGMTGAVVVR